MESGPVIVNTSMNSTNLTKMRAKIPPSSPKKQYTTAKRSLYGARGNKQRAITTTAKMMDKPICQGGIGRSSTQQ